MIRPIILCLVVFVVLSPLDIWAVLWEDTEVFGRAKLEGAYENFTTGEVQKNEQSIYVEIKSGCSESVSLKTIIRAIHENELQVDELTELDLREFYIDYRPDWAKIRLGRQQVVWGKTDGLRLLDLINPQDFREFILDDFIDSRIPLWMLRIDLYVGDDTLQVLIIPDYRSNKQPEEGDRYEPLFLKNIRSGQHSVEDKPEKSLSNSEAGLRYSGFAGGWDYTFNYFHSWTDDPVYFRGSTGGQEGRFKRTNMLGGSTANAFGSFVFRGEAAVTLDKYFATIGTNHHDGQVKKTEFNAALALEYTKGDWLFSTQVFERFINDYESGIVIDESTTLASFLINVKFLNETLDIKFLNIYGFNDGDNLARFTISYDITDNWKILGGASILSGPDSTFFGQFDDADRIEAELTYNFSVH